MKCKFLERVCFVTFKTIQNELFLLSRCVNTRVVVVNSCEHWGFSADCTSLSSSEPLNLRNRWVCLQTLSLLRLSLLNFSIWFSLHTLFPRLDWSSTFPRFCVPQSKVPSPFLCIELNFGVICQTVWVHWSGHSSLCCDEQSSATELAVIICR